MKSFLREPQDAGRLRFRLEAVFSHRCYELRVWIDNFASLPAIESEVRKQIWYAFKRYGITIPFPQRDVNFRRAIDTDAARRSKLVVTGGPLRGAVFPLADKTMKIGRDLGSDIFVSDAHVSTTHAVVEPCPGGYRLRDLESRHGTRVNGRLVASAKLEQGDRIRVGPVTLTYECNIAPERTVTEKRIEPLSEDRLPPADSGDSDRDTLA